MVEKHFLDSLTLLLACKVKEGAKVIDVGTGAGFPGLVLKILDPTIQLTLLDSLGKRVDWLGNCARNCTSRRDPPQGPGGGTLPAEGAPGGV